MELPSRRRNVERLWPATVLVDPPWVMNATPQKPVSLTPTRHGPAVRLYGRSQRPRKRFPKPPFRPSALLRLHKKLSVSEPTPSPVSRKLAVDAHWNHAERPPPSFSSPLKPISLPGLPR